MARAWGYWTRGKLDVLRRYLDAYTTASKGLPERIYLDAFAGEPNNEERLTGMSIDGSARIALSIDDPPFTRVRLFEQERTAAALEAALRADFPDRDLKVHGGDCNERIPDALAELSNLSWAPTFAFVDPNGHEAEWRSLKALSQFRPAHLTKTELFLLFAAPMFTRLLRVDGTPVRPEDETAIEALFGTSEWRHIYEARLARELEPSQARDEYLNLMRWRLERQLGYRWTHPLEVRNERGQIIYHMIFATDHEAGDRIMRNIYAQAAAEFPAMREQARRLRKQQRESEIGVMSLFGESDDDYYAPPKPGERFYEYEAPTRPWFMAADTPQAGAVDE